MIPIYFYEDSFQPVQYWKNRRAIRSTIVMPIDQVKKMKQQKPELFSKEDKREFSFYFYKSDAR
jgi:hypothetical protein